MEEERIVEELHGRKYKDKRFKGARALFIDPGNPYDGAMPASAVCWLSPSEIIRGEPKLFVDGISSGDIIQGTLGDCWFLGAVAAIAAHDPKMLSNIFKSTKNSELGIYTLQFFKNGKWTDVVVDDYIPCDNTKKPIFATAKDESEIWVGLIEKAYAKLHGSYEGLLGGTADYALADLTGGVAWQIDVNTPEVQQKLTSGLLWKDLLEEYKRGSIMTTCRIDTDGGVEEEVAGGILLNHAYSILELREYRGVALVKVRNPWGMKEWSGPWSDQSPEMSEAAKKALAVTVADDGTFWMSFEDAVKCFNQFQVCRPPPETWTALHTEGEWRGETAGGSYEQATWFLNPQYTLTVPRKTEVMISLAQPDARMSSGPAAEYPCNIQFLLCNDADGTGVLKRLTADTVVGMSGTYRPIREATLCTTLEKGRYLIVPSCYHKGNESLFDIFVYAKEKVTLEGARPVDRADLPQNGPSLTEAAVIRKPVRAAETHVVSKLDTAALMVDDLAKRLARLEEDVREIQQANYDDDEY